ncbi:MAG TPA: radical SAM protein, partial [Candidatus Ozemobacteraceae bacterium]|nr:radical SAM protein [Candidatus Ozemobacteraceae bacterium]
MNSQSIGVGFVSGASLTLTRRCRHRCGYCSFRLQETGVPLLSLPQIETDLNAIVRMGITEVTFEAGEAPQEFPEVVLALRENGCESLGEYLTKVSAACLARNLLPVFSLGEISPLEARQLAQSAAMQKICVVAADLRAPGEAHEEARGRHPAAARHQIEIAHEAGLPYRLSFLIGIGEHHEERERAIVDFGRFCAADPLLQDVELHPFQPQSVTAMRGRPPLPFAAVAQAMSQLAKAFPVHCRSIAPHLFYH